MGIESFLFVLGALLVCCVLVGFVMWIVDYVCYRRNKKLVEENADLINAIADCEDCSSKFE